jgi:hypothetical protein
MVSELGGLARLGARDPASVVGPFVDLVVALRDAARHEQRFADADAVRDRLAALGIEVRDAPGGSVWGFVDGATGVRGATGVHSATGMHSATGVRGVTGSQGATNVAAMPACEATSPPAEAGDPPANLRKP